MFENIQKFFHWASALPAAPKLVLSLVVVAVAAFALAVMWIPQQSAPESDLWPEVKTMDGLRRRLDRISKENAILLKVVAESGRYGIYPDELAAKIQKPRDEAVYRAKDLQTQGLIDISPLTDLNFRLNKDLVNLPGGTDFILRYLN